jgi:hypothetical protein
MEFRWVAGITLWTFICGPAVGPPAARHTPLGAMSQASPPAQRKVIRHGAHEPKPKFPGSSSRVSRS